MSVMEREVETSVDHKLSLDELSYDFSHSEGGYSLDEHLLDDLQELLPWRRVLMVQFPRNPHHSHIDPNSRALA